MTVHELKRTSLMDVPAKLRELADYCEREDIPTVVVVIGYPGGYVALRGYGEQTSAVACSGWLARAQTAMTEGCSVTDDVYVAPEPAANCMVLGSITTRCFAG